MGNTKDKLFRDKTLRHLHDDLNICGVVRNRFMALCMKGITAAMETKDCPMVKCLLI